MDPEAVRHGGDSFSELRDFDGEGPSLLRLRYFGISSVKSTVVVALLVLVLVSIFSGHRYNYDSSSDDPLLLYRYCL